MGAHPSAHVIALGAKRDLRSVVDGSRSRGESVVSMAFSHAKLVVSPLLAKELGDSPTVGELAAFRPACVPSAKTVLGALSELDRLSVEHAGVRATVLWIASNLVHGERAVIGAVELRTTSAAATVVEVERGFDRALGVPAAPDARERAAQHLRATIELCLLDDSLPAECFSSTVADFLRELPARLAAAAPEASLGRWVLDHGLSALEGETGVLALARGQRLSVHLCREGDAHARVKDGIAVTLSVELRRVGKGGKVLSAVAQPISMGLVGADTMFEAPPDQARREAAIEALRRWKAEVARRVAEMPTRGAASLMPMDLPWPTAPIALAVQALRHGAPGPRPLAGRLGDKAHETAKALREVAHPEALLSGAMRAWEVRGFTCVLCRSEDDDERVEECCWVRRDAGPFLPLVIWIDDEQSAFSADADEPAMRLIADWMRLALTTSGLDRELPTGILPSTWWLLGDGDGEPLDHRIEEGMVSTRSYGELGDELISGELAAHAAEAAELSHALIRELIDADACFGLPVANLGLP